VPLRIILIERRAQIGRGLAYSEAACRHLLNVPASRMSANPVIPSEFFDFARGRDPTVGIDDFLPRGLYGEYLQDSLHRAQTGTTTDCQIVHGAVRAITGGAGRPFTLYLDGIPPINADRVALCIGAPPPASVCRIEPAAKAQGYSGFAYEPRIEFAGDREILLLGTGLTMADIAIAADTQNSSIVVHALSRHGLLPKAQSAGPSVTANLFDIDALPDTSLRTVFRYSRTMADEVARRGGDWRDAVVALRGIASRLWTEWTEADRRRFLRHIRALWDINRHRLPPQTMTHLQRMQDANRLHVHAGQIRELSIEGGRIRADWVSRQDAEPRVGWFDRVINCTGASCRLEDWQDPLVQALRSEGLICADALGLGLRTGQKGVAIGSSGAPTDNLYYLGPMLRADYWEATATNELRNHAANLAGHLLYRSGKLRRAAHGRECRTRTT
jgi:uncharacterized NAD(P)/FAD-binding protein YdhS